jgi:twitching motility protein PilU
MAMQRLFELMRDKSASDLFLTVNSPIHIKINGNLVPINQKKMDPANIRALLAEILSTNELETLEVKNELNCGVTAAGIGRFRLSAFRQRGDISAVFRFVPATIPPLKTLNVPDVLADLIMEKRGLILVVGATGAGKSTTIASMLDYRNEVKTGHIFTIEDPIEYLFKAKKSIINQREIGVDCESLQVALKNSLRQAPDCILIGEIRDLDTMMAAIAYAQSGHLVLATLHANNSYQALNRIISFFPMDNRNALLLDLSSSIRAIVSQRLIRAIDGGRVPAVEILLNTRYVAELIEAGDIFQIREAIEKSLAPGSQTFEHDLVRLIKEEKISQDEGMANADSANNLLWLLNNYKDPNSDAVPLEQEHREEASFTEFTLNM